MKTFRHFWRYLVKFILKWGMFEAEVVENIKTHILCSRTVLRKSHRLWDNSEKCCGDRGATNDVTVWRIRVACWISKVTSTCAPAHAHAPEYPHARTHRPVNNTYYFSSAAMIRNGASVLRYTCIACIVVLYRGCRRKYSVLQCSYIVIRFLACWAA
jgi:hypothetical protein